MRIVDDLYSRIGIERTGSETFDSADFTLDAHVLSLKDQSGRYALIQCRVQPLSPLDDECHEELRQALILNVGLILSSSASLAVEHDESGVSYLVSRATYPYTANNHPALLQRIEDVMHLAEFTARYLRDLSPTRMISPGVTEER